MDDIRVMGPLTAGRFRARAVEGAADMARLLALRARCFRGDAGVSDADAFDATSDHVLIEERDSGVVLGGFRLRLFRGAGIGASYSAQRYDLARLHDFPAPMLELGRFCLLPGHPDADLLRLAWGAIAARVDAQGVGLLFGCSSFAGCDAAPYRDAFALLRDRHGAPERWRPGPAAPETVRFADLAPGGDPRHGIRALPALLRSYLAMGGWVGDHAVVDRTLNTLHVFTGLDITRVPAGRARALRALAEQARAAPR